MLPKISALIVITMLLFYGCANDATQEVKTAPVNGSAHQTIVQEVINTSNYSYLRVAEAQDEYWVAITRREVSVGDAFTYDTAMEMNDFWSKELEKNFEKILFVSEERVPTANSGMDSPESRTTSSKGSDITVTPAKGGITVAELYANRVKYSGKQVIIRGKVTKFNQGIMDRNWVHLQDGTNNDGNYDLTVTTNEAVQLGDVVTFSGMVTLDKDFGAGYRYAVIMESARRAE